MIHKITYFVYKLINSTSKHSNLASQYVKVYLQHKLNMFLFFNLEPYGTERTKIRVPEVYPQRYDHHYTTHAKTHSALTGEEVN